MRLSREYTVIAIICVVTAVGLVVAYRYLTTSVMRGTVDSYAVEYVVESDGPLQHVGWTRSPDGARTAPTVPVDVDGPLEGPFSVSVVVGAGREASVSATPAPGSTASCRIVRDQGRDREETLDSVGPGAAGEQVTCTAVLPTDEALFG